MVLKFLGNHKKPFLMFFLGVVMCSFTFADAVSEVNGVIGNIVNFFSNNWVKGIACIAFIAECLGLLFAGGQNPQVFKKFLPLLAGTILFMCAGKIVSLVFGSNTQDFSTDLDLPTNKPKTSMLLPDSESSRVEFILS